MMQRENPGPLISELCCTAGQQVGIGFRSPPPLGTQDAGRWERGFQPTGFSWRATFTYWLSPNIYLKESVVWPYGFQTKQQDSALFSANVNAKLKQMQQWILTM